MSAATDKMGGPAAPQLRTGALGLLEVLAGKKLSEVLAERIWQPLGMVDTSFQVPAAKLSRAAQPGARDQCSRSGC